MASAYRLTGEELNRVDGLVATGDYASRDAVVAAGLDLLERQRFIAMIESKVAESRADMAAGRVRPMEAVFDDLQKRLASL